MKKIILPLFLFVQLSFLASGQATVGNSIDTVNLGEVIITGNRVPVSLMRNPGSVSLVTTDMLKTMPRSAAVEEALRFVPGVRIDNQHNGERVHVSIRGQGILTERGLRGIGVIIDGLPLNDPSGFAPDLYDIDWATVSRVEVLRGPAAGLYGGSSSGGVLNIITADGSKKPLGGLAALTFGSNGFAKSLFQVDGSGEDVNYRASVSRTDGDGYRDHQAFWANKIYEKLTYNPSDKVEVTQVISHSDYFQQNPEGLNLGQFDNLRQANPDARPFNEYQKTNRTTFGFHAAYTPDKYNQLEVTSYLRSWKYKETSNRCAEYRNVTNPGFILQYNLHLDAGIMMNTFSIGTDLKYQDVDMYKLQSGSDPARIESIDETNIELDSLMANQIIRQKNVAFFALFKTEAGRFSFLGSVRYDKMGNRLTNKLMGSDTATTNKNFSRASVRLGASYSVNNALTLFANWSQGFIPPSTEELANNPVGYSGFNTHLVPATSSSIDLGLRGFAGKKIHYELTAFLMKTGNDFFRFKQSGRGNQEVFYGNAGNSTRKGIETYFSWHVTDDLVLQAAYTLSDYRYTSASVDPVYTNPAYVLTLPPAAGQWLPNSPRHQLFTGLEYSPGNHLTFNVSSEVQSKWAIYTDAKAYSGQLDDDIYRNWQKGFTMINAGVTYAWKLGGLQGECSLNARNLAAVTYMAFTEPDPDGNSYQPGPSREIFASVKLRF